MFSKMITALGGLAYGVFALAAFAIFIAGPYFVARVFPVQAYTITEIAATIAFLICVLAALIGIFRAARVAMGTTLYVGSWVVAAFLWVWSVLIIDQNWGIVALYVANVFFAVGAIVLAFIEAIWNGQWNILWQLAVIAAVLWAMRIGGAAMITSMEPKEEAVTYFDEDGDDIEDDSEDEPSEYNLMNVLDESLADASRQDQRALEHPE